MRFVFDASVVIAFMTEMDDGEYLRSLSLAGHILIVTDGVVNEVKKEPGVSRLKTAIDEKWMVLQSTSRSEFDSFKHRFPMLDYAEVEVLQKGLEFKHCGLEYCCVLDEGPGRKIADGLELTKIGTEGLLDKLSDSKIIDASTKERLLNKLGQSTFRRSSPNISVSK